MLSFACESVQSRVEPAEPAAAEPEADAPSERKTKLSEAQQAPAGSGETVAAAPSGPPQAFDDLPADERRLVGVVEQVLVAGSYRYLAVREDDQRLRWAVLATGEPQVGARVELDVFGRKQDFRSHRLDRSFARLDFAALAK